MTGAAGQPGERLVASAAQAEARPPTAKMARRSGKVQSIELGRGVAATLVVLAHATGYTTVGGGNALGGLFRFGTVGVDFFFALSGFIIFYVHRSDLGRPERFARYAWRRFVRIYPLYIGLTLASLPLIALLPFYRADVPHSAYYFVANLLLVPYGQTYPILAPAWSLSHEVVFYFVFGVAILHWRGGVALMAAWLMSVLYAKAASIELGGISFALFAWLNIIFAFGIAAAFLAPKLERGGMALFLIGLCIFVPACLAFSFDIPPMTTETVRRLVYGLTSGVMIVGMTVWERQAEVRFPPWALTWGAASYAIYLVHYPVLELLSLARCPARPYALDLRGSLFVHSDDSGTRLWADRAVVC